MPDLLTASFDSCALAFFTCLALREVFVFSLPDAVAGPGGWLIDTDPRD